MSVNLNRTDPFGRERSLLPDSRKWNSRFVLDLVLKTFVRTGVAKRVDVSTVYPKGFIRELLCVSGEKFLIVDKN